jgi:hypothetical protein
MRPKMPISMLNHYPLWCSILYTLPVGGQGVKGKIKIGGREGRWSRKLEERNGCLNPVYV